MIQIRKVLQNVLPADHLLNSANKRKKIDFIIYRNQLNMAILRSSYVKPYGEFWDMHSNRKIKKSEWSLKMEDFARVELRNTKRPAYIFKITALGWIFLLVTIALLIFVIYDSNYPHL